MRKRGLAFVLVVGLALAVLVSACGVALVPVQYTAGGPTGLSPVLAGLNVPGLLGLHQPSVLGARHQVQRMTAHNQAQTLDEFGVGSCHLQQ